MTKDIQVTQVVKKHYAKVAKQDTDCCSSNSPSTVGCSSNSPSTVGCSTQCGCGDDVTAEEISAAIGYSKDEMNLVPEANLGLGCGNPIALGTFHEGETVLDLGSGAGIDCFLAAQKVGQSGHVIGVDMTDEMLEKARKNAITHGFKNVEFRKGYIDNLPIDDSSIDIIISNCV
ncbi:MAG: methyltransferase domain-containing protein, partial [Thermoplasmata archaeon]|nr:methyltransferase domain-containing protein [Thermoplasmata archaeon]